MTKEDLVFVEVREHSPQWEVRFRSRDGSVIARVTERYVASPAFRVCCDGRPDVDVATREDVVRVLLEGAGHAS